MGEFVYGFLKRFFRLIFIGIIICVIIVSVTETYFGFLRNRKLNNYINFCSITYLANYNGDIQEKVLDPVDTSFRNRINSFCSSLASSYSNFSFLQTLIDVNNNFTSTNFAIVPQNFGVSYIDLDYIKTQYPQHVISMLGVNRRQGHVYTDNARPYSSMGGYINSLYVWTNGMFEIDPYSVKIEIVKDSVTGKDYTVIPMNDNRLKEYLYGTTVDSGRDTVHNDGTIVVTQDVVMYILKFEYEVVIPYVFQFTMDITGNYGVRRTITKYERYFVTR